MKQPKSNKNFTPLENFKKQPSENVSVMESTYNGMFQSGMQGSCRDNIVEITLDEKKIPRVIIELFLFFVLKKITENMNFKRDCRKNLMSRN